MCTFRNVPIASTFRNARVPHTARQARSWEGVGARFCRPSSHVPDTACSTARPPLPPPLSSIPSIGPVSGRTPPARPPPPPPPAPLRYRRPAERAPARPPPAQPRHTRFHSQHGGRFPDGHRLLNRHPRHTHCHSFWWWWWRRRRRRWRRWGGRRPAGGRCFRFEGALKLRRRFAGIAAMRRAAVLNIGPVSAFWAPGPE